MDNSYLIDYLGGDDGAQAWLEANEDQPLSASTIALYETYRGVLWVASSMAMDEVFETFDWTTVMPFDEAAAREAVLIQRELREDGTPDVMIGVIARSVGLS